MKEELIKEMSYNLNLVMDYDSCTYSEDCGYGEEPYADIEIHYDKIAKNLIDMGWTKPTWHKVSQNDFPTRQGQKVWLCTTSKDYFMANYWDNTKAGGQKFFEMPNGFRIILSNVLAWTELPRYEEESV